MTDTARDYQQIESAAVEGLEELFGNPLDSVQREDFSVRDTVQDFIPVTEAANLLGVDRRSVVRLLSWKKLSGTKDDRGRWLVSKSSVLKRLDSAQPGSLNVSDSVQPESLNVSDSVQPESLKVSDSVQPESLDVLDSVQPESLDVPDGVQLESLDVSDSVQPESPNVSDSGRTDILPGPTNAAVVDVDELLRKLEGATYRIGYLEAQLEAERQQVKLLTDSQHKPSWWSKFKSWFLGAP